MSRKKHLKANRGAWYAMLIFLGIIFVAAIWVSLEDLREDKRIQSNPPLRSYYESVRGIPLQTLEASRREKVLRQLNSTKCTCECKLTLAQCRNTDRTCKKSLELGLQVLNAPSH